ncbi:ABC transporter permease [Deinococcus maricopensis]|uniref:ABC-type transporter, integral membrane subunit n=1 Tax=Deinococcus maricopensis (strain DSM 21211 / LMG 22137 / NRRL B-23946 / LB-34) TaxID=709986 RepID=E8UBP1_DEIML|nr:ABC transporter permease [Deinococcus maricopensis]ADV68480.1 ABC-type transporter, integral membrane subunit [Deinococcus maricopensis DSM 21211]
MKVWKKFSRNPLGVFGLVLAVLFALMALFAPVLAPMPKDQGNVRTTFTIPERMASEGYSSEPTKPNATHKFGLSENGYDIKFGVVWGARTAFVISIVIVAISLIVGLLVGTIAGFYGGWVDTIMMRFTDIIFSFPSILLLIVLATVLGRELWVLMLAFAAVGWGTYARLIRSEILKIKRLEYVEAARAIGARDLRLIMKHVIPNSLGSLLVVVTNDIGSIVVSFAALSFIGVGAPSGFPDWGQLINLSKNWITRPEYAFTYLYPGVALILFSLSWNLIGDSLRDAIDPRSR